MSTFACFPPPLPPQVPHGLVFSCFMTACMVGSALTGLLMRRMRVEDIMPWVYMLAALSLAVPLVFHLEMRDEAVGGWGGDGRRIFKGGGDGGRGRRWVEMGDEFIRGWR